MRPLRSTYRHRLVALGATIVGAALVLACGGGDDDPDPSAGRTTDTEATVEALPERQGGMTTTFDDTAEAFARSARSLANDDRRRFGEGDTVFEAHFTESDEDEFTGLGELVDGTGCMSCHVNDGRANGPQGDGPLPEGFVVKLDSDDPDVLATYGSQLQRTFVDTLSGDASTGDGLVEVRYEDVEGTYEDGTPFTLRRPVYETTDLAHGDLPGDTVLSVRQAPPLVGLGLLELITVDDLMQIADPDDADGDGISGELGVARVPFRDEPLIGRFGWQAEAASVEHQTALALFHDLGVTNHWFPRATCETDPDDCPRPDGPVDPEALEYQVDRSGENAVGGEGAEYEEQDSTGGAGGVSETATELADRDLHTLTVYTQALAVPALRDADDPEVIRGKGLFDDLGCASCHVGPFTTGSEGMPGLTEQVIDPGTDLLLYDLGEDLADRTVAGEPVPTQWRTPPLWGLGLAEVIGEYPTYLHDGRARTVEEAILWHGGEAFPARERFRSLTAAEREAVLTYLAAR